MDERVEGVRCMLLLLWGDAVRRDGDRGWGMLVGWW